VAKLIDHIWSLRESKPTFSQIKTSQEYTNCKEIFKPEYAFLLDEAIKEMICDISDYDKHVYILSEKGEIGYKLQD
jgi:hypothetical protein